MLLAIRLAFASNLLSERLFLCFPFAYRFLRRAEEAVFPRKPDVDRFLVSEDVQHTMKHRGRKMHSDDAVGQHDVLLKLHARILESDKSQRPTLCV